MESWNEMNCEFSFFLFRASDPNVGDFAASASFHGIILSHVSCSPFSIIVRRNGSFLAFRTTQPRYVHFL